MKVFQMIRAFVSNIESLTATKEWQVCLTLKLCSTRRPLTDLASFCCSNRNDHSSERRDFDEEDADDALEPRRIPLGAYKYKLKQLQWAKVSVVEDPKYPS